MYKKYKRNTTRLVKRSKEKMCALKPQTKQNDFEGAKKLSSKWVKRSNNDTSGIKYENVVMICVGK